VGSRTRAGAGRSGAWPLGAASTGTRMGTAASGTGMGAAATGTGTMGTARARAVGTAASGMVTKQL
jgi:hypothetical protein